MTTIVLRPMTLADVPLGMRLKGAAGWNQTPQDWQMLLEAGFGLVASVGDSDVGTATVVPYPGLEGAAGFSWIGMVLVDPAFRRRGIGTQLLEAAIAAAEPYGAVGLDATPQGRPLYAQMGFIAHYGLVRMRRPAAPLVAGPPDTCDPVSDAMLPDLIRWDAPVFGAQRAAVLQALARRAPAYAISLWRAGTLVGYIMGRSGSDAEQLGPLIAEDETTAQALLSAALRACAGRPVIVAVPTDRGPWVGWLDSLGFVRRRPFTRMVLGSAAPLGTPNKQFAIAGPEIS